MTENYVFELCVLSLLCGVIINLMPKGGIKDISCILCTAILISNILSGLDMMNIKEYFEDESITANIENEFSERVAESERNMKIKVMEQQCEKYILDKAYELGVSDAELEIIVTENESTYLLPYAIEFRGKLKDSQREQLVKVAEEDLGIPEERQVWISG